MTKEIKDQPHSIAFPELMRRLGDEATAEKLLIHIRWPDGMRCPYCDSDSVADVKYRTPMPYRCRDCRKHFSVKSNSPLHGSKLPLSKWVIAFVLSSNFEVSPGVEFHEGLGVRKTSAWHIAHRIREAWDIDVDRSNNG